MNDNVEAKYKCIMDVARTLSMEEIQVLERMLLDLWCDKYSALCKENKNELQRSNENVQSDIQE